MGRSRVLATELKKQVFEEQLMRETKTETFWNKFESTGPDSVVHVKKDLTKSKGAIINFGLMKDIPDTEMGVKGNEQMKGKEVPLQDRGDKVELERYRQAVTDDGDLDRQRAVYDMSTEARTALKDWGRRFIDRLKFKAMGLLSTSSGTELPSLVFYRDASGNFAVTSNPATAKAALHATNSKLTLDFITQLHAFADTGGNYRFNPIRPVMVGGKEHVILLTHPDAVADLKLTDAWKQASRDAAARGKDNPIFTGDCALFDNVIIHVHRYCATAKDAGGSSDVPWARSVLLGAQAVLWAEGKAASIVTEKEDYEEFEGNCWRLTCGTKKARFDNQDFGSIGIYLATSGISDTVVAA